MLSRFHYKWKSHPLFFKIPPTFRLPFPKYLLIFSHFPFPHEFHRLKSLTMSQYKTQGPYLQQLHTMCHFFYVHWCIRTVKGENDRMFVQWAAVTYMMFLCTLSKKTQNDIDKEMRKKSCVHGDVSGIKFCVWVFSKFVSHLSFLQGCGLGSEMSVFIA